MLFQADISWSVNDMPQGTIKHPLGYIPIMVKSKLCNLYDLSPQELMQHHEEEEVTGICGSGKSAFSVVFLSLFPHPLPVAHQLLVIEYTVI